MVNREMKQLFLAARCTFGDVGGGGSNLLAARNDCSASAGARGVSAGVRFASGSGNIGFMKGYSTPHVEYWHTSGTVPGSPTSFSESQHSPVLTLRQIGPGHYA